MIVWVCSLFCDRGVLAALTMPVKQTWHLMGVVSLPPTVGSVLATLLLPEHLCFGEREMA